MSDPPLSSFYLSSSQWLPELFLFFAGIQKKTHNPQLSWEAVSFFQIGKKTKDNEQIRKTLLADFHITFLPPQITIRRAKMRKP
jgi:hypothetical protein